MADQFYDGSSDPKNEYAHEQKDFASVHGPRPNPRLKPSGVGSKGFVASLSARQSFGTDQTN